LTRPHAVVGERFGSALSDNSKKVASETSLRAGVGVSTHKKHAFCVSDYQGAARTSPAMVENWKGPIVKALSIIPYRTPFCPPSQASTAGSYNHSTFGGWVERFPRLGKIGIAPAKRGVTRFMTMEQIGLLSVFRTVVQLGQAEAFFDALSDVITHAADLYQGLARDGQWVERTSGELRPYLPRPEDLSPPQPSKHLQAQIYWGRRWSFSLTDRPYSDGGVGLMDLNCFPVPSMLVPLDAMLRNAWMRGLWIFNEIGLEDY
jgi:hypothetical protein